MEREREQERERKLEQERERKLERKLEQELEREREREQERERKLERERERERERKRERERERKLMSSVALTRIEAQWVSRNVIKTLSILEAASKQDAEILKRKTYVLLDQLRAQAGKIAAELDSGKEDGLYLTMTRDQRKVVVALIDATVKSLTDFVIPKYVERGQADYANATRAKVDLITEMRRKVR